MDNLLPAPYLTKLNNVIQTANATQEPGKRREIFNKYCKTFTAIPDFWDHWLMLERNGKSKFLEEDAKFIKQLRKIALSHFFDKRFLTEMSIASDGRWADRYPDNNRAYQKVFSLPYFHEDFYNVIKEKNRYLQLFRSYLTFPHQHIEAVFDLYQEHSDTFIPSEAKWQYKKNFDFFQKLNKAFEENRIEDWFKLLLDTQDEDLIIQNMEYYIGKRPHSRAAWSLYILYLYLNDKKEILGVYSRFCRFFVGDRRIINQYFKEIISQQKSGNNCIKYIYDFLDLTSSFNSESYEEELLKLLNPKELQYYKNLEEKVSGYETSLTYLKSLDYSALWFMDSKLSFLKTYNAVGNGELATLKTAKLFETSTKCSLKWSEKNLQNQRFPFCSTIMRHISKDTVCRQKLNQTCKYFFAMTEIPIAYGLRIKEKNGDGLKYCGATIEISKDFFNQQISRLHGSLRFREFITNTPVTTVLSICNSTNPNCFTQLMSAKNDIKFRYLTLSGQNLFLYDISLIQEKCKLISVKLINCDIFMFDGEIAAVENVVKILPTVKYLELNCESLIYTPVTASKLITLRRRIKFKRFAIFGVTDAFDLKAFCFFLEKFAAPYCHLCVNFHPNFEADLQPKFERIMELAKPWLNPLVIVDH